MVAFLPSLHNSASRANGCRATSACLFTLFPSSILCFLCVALRNSPCHGLVFARCSSCVEHVSIKQKGKQEESKERNTCDSAQPVTDLLDEVPLPRTSSTLIKLLHRRQRLATSRFFSFFCFFVWGFLVSAVVCSVPLATAAVLLHTMTVIVEELKKKYSLQVSAEYVDRIRQASPSVTAADVYKKVLHENLKDVNDSSALPFGIASQVSTSLPASVVLQINSSRDATQPLRPCGDGAFQRSSRHRLLRLVLTDGQVEIPALELSTLRVFTGVPIPGEKLLIKAGADVRNGAIIMTDDNTVALGGEVSSLKQEFFAHHRRLEAGYQTSAGLEGAPRFEPLNRGQHYHTGDHDALARAGGGASGSTPPLNRGGSRGGGGRGVGQGYHRGGGDQADLRRQDRGRGQGQGGQRGGSEEGGYGRGRGGGGDRSYGGGRGGRGGGERSYTDRGGRGGRDGGYGGGYGGGYQRYHDPRPSSSQEPPVDLSRPPPITEKNFPSLS